MDDAHPLNVMVIGAHPDDCEYYAGGTAAKFIRHGHRVKFISTTNGDIGHHEMSGGELARVRREEVRRADSILGITAFEIFDIHDGEIEPTVARRKELIRRIREWNADIVISHRPGDYHPDHRYTGMLVQDTAYQVMVPNVCPDVPALRKSPVYLYLEDTFAVPHPFRPDVIVPIDDVFEKKIDALHEMTSQFYEWLPWTRDALGEVPKAEEERRQWLDARIRKELPNRFPGETRARYGREYDTVETFELSEYGDEWQRRITRKELGKLFPFLPVYV